jgi:Secretion system C-terminal sorting domain
MAALKTGVFVFVISLIPAWAGAQHIINTGNWNSTTTWQGSTIASTLADNVTIDDNLAVTVAGGDNYTVGSFTSGLTNTLTIALGGTLNLGDSGTPGFLNASTNMTINASGDLVIWGDLNVTGNNLTLSVTVPGHIIVKGNLIVADNSSFTVNGDLEVDGAFTGGNFTDVTVNGNIFVYGPTTVGANSNVIGGGHFHAYGGCSGPAGFCMTSPIELLSFTAEATTTNVKLRWATASEINVDYFLIERSVDGKIYSEVGTVQGHGTSKERNDYALEDVQPYLGKAYYRLTEVDLDRSVTHHNLVAVDFTGTRSLSVFPNPTVSKEVTLRLNFIPQGAVDISIIDLRGAILSQFTLNESEVTVPIQVAAGTYIVRVQASDYSTVSRLVVR